MKLSKEELQQLIDAYRTELRLLTYRTKQVTGQLKGLAKEERTAKPKKGPGRPAKKAAGKRGRPAKKTAGKRGRPAKKTAGKRGRPAKKAAGKRGRPVKKAAGKRGGPAKKVAGKRGRPAKKAGGYRLNVWDEIVLKTLRGKKKAGVFSDFFGAAKRTSAARGLSQKDLYARINQSLHKLANKRGAIKKVEHEGRGFGYQVV